MSHVAATLPGMSGPSSPERIDQPGLYARLAEGHAARITVVTPNARLAQALASGFDRSQLARGLISWEAADILPLGAFVERCYEDLLYSDEGASLPRLLAPAEEEALWEELVRASKAGEGLLAIPEAAQLAREAFDLAEAWQLAGRLKRAPLHDDAIAWLGWSKAYAARTRREGLIERARLPAFVAARLDREALRKPKVLVAYAFDLLTPRQQAFFDALSANGVEVLACGPVRQSAAVVRLPCLDSRDELRRAARWARARLEADANARIGVVVPSLERERGALQRIFRQTFDPGGVAAAHVYTISLGAPLSATPLVAHALAILELCGREIAFERASLILRSPFLAAAGSEAGARAKADAQLRRRAEPALTLDRLATLIQGAPVLGKRLAALAEFRRERLFTAQSPRAWAEAFGDALQVLGFPGERSLDSTEFQTHQRLQALLAEFARLERVAPKMGFGEALARVARLAAATLFQPEAGDVPIRIMGALEAAGQAFDHLWVTGLSDNAWPLHPAANPFLPISVQREAGIPNASPAATLALARALTDEWLSCAAEIVLSHPAMEDDRRLQPSPLIASITEGALDLPEFADWRTVIHRAGAGALEQLEDARLPALAANAALSGGARVLADQSACPFRAAAVHRLAAESLEAPHAGLDAMERGTLVHRVLAAAWRELKDKAGLDAIAAPALDALLEKAAREAVARIRRDRPTVLGGRFEEIEVARLVRLARDWLATERDREPFSVVAIEDKRALEVGPLALNARLDRVDETSDGARIVIDYKTGKTTPGVLLGARPDEPQLPLYLAASEPGASALAFAQVRAGEMKFNGLAERDGLLPGVSTPQKSRSRSAAADWPSQVIAWRSAVETLAGEFAAGEAAVDPKRFPDTCRYCDVKPLCRVYERFEGGEGEE